MKALLLLLALLNLAPNLGFSCTCDTLQKITKQDVFGADAIFTGKIIDFKIDRANKLLIGEFKIKKLLKGNLNKKRQKIATELTPALCGLNFNYRQIWYIFSSSMVNDIPFVNLCGRSAILNKDYYAPQHTGRINFIRDVVENELEHVRARREIKFVKQTLRGN